MGARGRGYRSPLEVMVPAPPSRKWSGRSAPDAVTSSGKLAVTSAGHESDTGGAMVQVPRGLGVMMVLVALGLILLSYWVGHHRGAREGIAAAAAEFDAEQALVFDGIRATIAADKTGQSASSPSTTPPESSVETGSRIEPAATVPGDQNADPRRIGLNYFVLARDTLAGARRLVEFLGRQGVEAVAIRGENARMYKVVAMDHAFSRDEVGGPVFKTYRRRLVELGRRWEETYEGVVSFEKQGMYAERFDGLSSGRVKVITRRNDP